MTDVTLHIKEFERGLARVFPLLHDSVFEVEQADVVQKTFTRILTLFVAASQAIEEKYRQSAAALGRPLAPVKQGAWTSGGAGYYRRYEHGAVYWFPDQGARTVSGAIYQKYLTLGAEAGFLGYPQSDEAGAPDGQGRYCHFQAGSIFWTLATGAHEVHGTIRDKWSLLGWQAGLLGYPTTDETATPDGIGRYNHFQGGSIYWTPESGANEVHGAIRDRWAALGWETSYLGYPTFDQQGDMSRFQRGLIRIVNGQARDVADARVVQSGVMHVNGAAANGWSELTINSAGQWHYKGSIRSTGALSYDVAIATAFNFQAPETGRALAFAEAGDVEGTLVLGGNRAHTWERSGRDAYIAHNWDGLRAAGVKHVLRVDFGAGDVLALVGSLLGFPLAGLGVALAGAWVDQNLKPCGREGHEYYNTSTHQWEREREVVFVSKGEPCPPGTHP
jgi:hypothetical protein